MKKLGINSYPQGKTFTFTLKSGCFFATVSFFEYFKEKSAFGMWTSAASWDKAVEKMKKVDNPLGVVDKIFC